MVRVSFLLLFSLALCQSALGKPKDSVSKPASSEKKISSKKKASMLKVVGGIALPMFVVGECMMYTYFMKATYEWLTNGKEARSFFAKQPIGATYGLKVTIKRFGSSSTHFFKAQHPKQLISEANNFISAFIKKEYPTDLLVRILLEPTITTKQGKVITLSPFYNLWNSKTGVTRELRKKFFSTSQSNADQVFEAVQLFTVGSLMTLTGPLLVAGVYRLRGTIFGQAGTTNPVLPS